MGRMDLINNLVKIFLISLFAYIAYEKIIKEKTNNKKYIIILLTDIIISLFYIILKPYLLPYVSIVILYSIYGIIISKFINKEFNILAYILSCVISYIIYLLAVISSGIIVFILLRNNERSNFISLVTVMTTYSLLFSFIFSRKRFKAGFNFLKNKTINNNVKKFIIFWLGIAIIIFGLPQGSDSKNFKRSLLIGIVYIAINIIIWIKSQITKSYKSKMRDRTIEIQKNEIDEKNRIIEEVKEENLKYATIIHKYNKKLSALEFVIKSKLEQETNTEFANELAVILKETKETAENFAKETEIKTNKLPETNIPGIDTMFKYMQEEARVKNINFDVKLNTSINNLLENTISKDKFETLIGDHLKDAIIAVEASTASYKSILVTLGLVEGIYELSICDTGIEFEIETLLKLGEEQVTTHKETGGSGIGFMTTFETLKECKASLVIEEYNPETTSYTKSVTIRFDGKNKYKIYSYRANKIKEQKHKRRIIIEELK